MSVELNKIHQSDCIEGMQKMDDNSVDLVFADPPFNLEKAYKTYTDDMSEEGYDAWCFDWIKEAHRVLKPGGAMFLHNIPKWLAQYTCVLKELKMDFRHWIAWNAPTAPMGTSLQPAHYGILYYTKPGAEHTFYEIRQTHARCRKCKCLAADYGGKKDTIQPLGPLCSDVITDIDCDNAYPVTTDLWNNIHRIKHKKYRNEGHPCQLPVHLLERIVLMASDEGQVCLDPFMGTGTTAVAAVRMGRQFVGFDLSEQYVNIGMSRVARQIPSKLGNPGDPAGNFYVSVYRGDVVSVRDVDICGPKKQKNVYLSQWTDLFKDWPDNGDKRKLLDTEKLAFKLVYKNKMDELAAVLKETDVTKDKKGASVGEEETEEEMQPGVTEIFDNIPLKKKSKKEKVNGTDGEGTTGSVQAGEEADKTVAT